MYNHIRALSTGYLISVPFFVSVVIIGNWILLNLFLAILLSNFEDEEEEDAPTLKELREKKFEN